jgi:hypothetical protein
MRANVLRSGIEVLLPAIFYLMLSGKKLNTASVDVGLQLVKDLAAVLLGHLLFSLQGYDLHGIGQAISPFCLKCSML